MKTIKTLLILIGILFGVGLLLYFKPIYLKPKQKTPKNESEIYQCKISTDCIGVDTVCKCSGGGGRKAINRAYIDYWKKKLQSGRQGTVCLAMISDNWRCSKLTRARCIKGKCEIKKTILNKIIKSSPDKFWHH